MDAKINFMTKVTLKENKGKQKKSRVTCNFYVLFFLQFKYDMKIDVNIIFSILLSRKFQILKEILTYFLTKHLLNFMDTFKVKHFAKKF